MLVYSNHMGMPHNLDIFWDRDEEFPFFLETININRSFRTIDKMLAFMIEEGITSKLDARILEKEIWKKISGCPYFSGRKCRGCSYSSDPDLWDGFCLYGRDPEDESKKRKEGKE